MSIALFILIGIAAGLLLVLGWALLGSKKGRESRTEAGGFEEAERRHIRYFAQVQQAMASGDDAFLASRGSKGLAQRVRRERRKIALAYLGFLRQDFQRLLRLARVIAVLSPRVGAAQEFERLRLSVAFSFRYQMIRIKLLLGLRPLPEMGSLSQVLSGFTVRLETAMKELGERATLAAELASSLDRSGLGTA